MRALVTGAAGFIGSTLTEELLRRGHDVVGVDSFTDYYEPRLKRENASTAERMGLTLVEADLFDADLDALLDDREVVFHLAGQPGVRKSWGAEFLHYSRNNIDATQRLLEAARRSRIDRFVYASSSSVYGDAERFPTQETDRPAPRSPYGVSKLAAEHLCSLYAQVFSVPTVSLRFFTVYGPRQRPDMAFRRFIEALADGRPLQVFGDGEQIREFTFVSDIVEANILASTSDVPPGAVINLSGGSSVTVNQVINELRAIHDRPIRVEHSGTVAGDVKRTGGSTQLAQRLLGWEPQVDISTGLGREYEWFMRREQKL